MNTIQYEEIDFRQINYNDPIFDSIKLEYTDLSDWHKHAMDTHSNRGAICIYSDQSEYSGILVYKLNNTNLGRTLKISTLKVEPKSAGNGIADCLLSAGISKAKINGCSSIYVKVTPAHEDIINFLESRGFTKLDEKTLRNEYVFCISFKQGNPKLRMINKVAYDLLAQEYNRRTIDPGPNQESSAYLAKSLINELTEKPGRLLELGPGSGDVLNELSKESCSVIAVEQSMLMAEISSKNAPKATVIQSDICKINFPEGHFDGIYAGAFFHLFPKNEALELLAKANSWLNSKGRMFINTSVSDVSKEGIEVKADYSLKVARFRSRWTEHEFTQLLLNSGFSIKKRITTNEEERKKYWVAYIVGKQNEE